jgi:hypothetical protein
VSCSTFVATNACWKQRSGTEVRLHIGHPGPVTRGAYSACGGDFNGLIPELQLPTTTLTETLKLYFDWECNTSSGVERVQSRDVSLYLVPPSSTFFPASFITNFSFQPVGVFDEVRSATIQAGGQGVPVNVSTITVPPGETAAASFATVNSSNIPGYSIVVNNATVLFGQNVGNASTCPNGGSGWLPASGGCPVSTPVAYKFPLLAQPATRVCRTGASSIGVYANGVLMRGPGGEGSYLNQGVWNEYVHAFKQSSFDLCQGHADAGGAYHHHGFSGCLQRQIEGPSPEPPSSTRPHSPRYGYAADGYAVHGPVTGGPGVARSCWKKRDYSAGSPTGCGVNGARTCLMANPEDINSGTVPAPSPGPSTSATAVVDGQTITLASGVYIEDYVFDPACPAQHPDNLDKHNGTDRDGFGLYHYHMTQEFQTAIGFPNGPGPTYRGEIRTGATGICHP